MKIQEDLCSRGEKGFRSNSTGSTCGASVFAYLGDLMHAFLFLATLILEPNPDNSLTEPGHLSQLFLHESVWPGVRTEQGG